MTAEPPTEFRMKVEADPKVWATLTRGAIPHGRMMPIMLMAEH